jgi:transcriptional regulator with XRE-family HTH domain
VTGALATTLGRRLREERRRRRLSLRKLARSSGLSTTTVHQIESGRGSPSLSTLQAVAATLDVPLASLFDDGTAPRGPAVSLPARARARTRTPGGSLEPLAAGLPGQQLRGLVLTIAPGGDTGEDAMVHPGQELVFGLRGRCVYEVGGEQHDIGPGDSLVIDSRRPHRARNPGRRPAMVLLCLYAPDGHSARAHGRSGLRRPTGVARSRKPR